MLSLVGNLCRVGWRTKWVEAILASMFIPSILEVLVYLQVGRSPSTGTGSLGQTHTRHYLNPGNNLWY